MPTKGRLRRDVKEDRQDGIAFPRIAIQLPLCFRQEGVSASLRRNHFHSGSKFMLKRYVAMPGGYLDDPFNPERMMDLDQLVSTLSNICRWNGRCSSYFSVLDHSLLLAELVPEELAWQALTHDFAEAYIGDIPQPVKEKPEMAWLAPLEADLNRRVWMHYAGFEELDPLVAGMDSRLAATEAEYLGLGGEWSRKRMIPGIPAGRFEEGGAGRDAFWRFVHELKAPVGGILGEMLSEPEEEESLLRP